MSIHTKHIFPSPDVAFQQIGEEMVLLNLKTGKYFSLDEVAARMWMHLMETHNLQATLEKMLEEYDVERERLQLHLNDFIAQLKSHELITDHENHGT